MKPVPAAATSNLSVPPPLPVVQGSQPVSPAHLVSAPIVWPIRIQGGLLTEVHGSPQWLYVSEFGRILTDDEIAQELGGIVNARMDRGVRILFGSGVVWGGAASTPAASNPIPVDGGVLPAPTVALRGAEERAPGEEAPPVPAGPGAQDLLARSPGLLATPPDVR